MSRRINVMISDELNTRVEEYSVRYGVSKSSLVAYALGQHLDQLERMNDLMYGSEGLLRRMAEVAKEEIEGQE